MRCAKCGAEGVERLPPNSFSRNPGFRCPQCGAVMRPPGSGLFYGGLIALGIAFVALGVILAVAFAEEGGRAWQAGALFGVLGLAAAGWSVAQLRLPTPIR